MTARLALVAGLLAATAVGLVAVREARPPALVLEGLPKGELNAAELRTTTVRVQTPPRPARLLLDGRVVDRAEDGLLQAGLDGLDDGRHLLVVEVDRAVLPGSSRASRVVRVDTAPPVVTVRGDRGTASDVRHLSTPEGVDVEVAADGSFRVPPGAAALVAVDDAGNRVEVRLPTGS